MTRRQAKAAEKIAAPYTAERFEDDFARIIERTTEELHADVRIGKKAIEDVNRQVAESVRHGTFAHLISWGRAVGQDLRAAWSQEALNWISSGQSVEDVLKAQLGVIRDRQRYSGGTSSNPFTNAVGETEREVMKDYASWIEARLMHIATIRAMAYDL